MTPRERLLAAYRGKPVDRVPINMEGFQFVSMDDIDDPGKKEICSRIFNETTYTVSHPSCVNRFLVTPPRSWKTVEQQKNADGSIVTTNELTTPKGPLRAIVGRNPISNTHWMIKYPCETIEDIRKIQSTPWELPKDDILSVKDRKLPDSFAERGILHAGVSSPFVCVAGMMSYEYFLELCLTEYDLVKELTQTTFERCYASIDYVLSNYDIELVWMGGCEWLTPPMASPKLYEELVHKFEAPIIERIHQAGAISHVHCHGNVRSTIKLVIERGADFFEPVEPPPDGDITMAEAKQIANGKMTLGGNIESRILEKGTVDEVEKAVYAAFEGGKERMILQTTAGPLNLMDSQTLKNYHKLVDIWEEMSVI